MDYQIEKLIDQALDAKLVKFNRHGVGSFYLSLDALPADITFDRHGFYDATLLNGNGCAQVRKNARLSRQGVVSVVFNIDPDIEE